MEKKHIYHITHLMPLLVHLPKECVPTSLVDHAAIPECCEVSQDFTGFSKHDDLPSGKNSTWFDLREAELVEPLKTIEAREFETP